MLKEAGRAMAGLHSVAAEVKFGPGIDFQGLELRSATSRIRLPGSSDTVFKVMRGDFLLDLHVVTTGGRVFIRLPFAQFTELAPAQAREVPDLARLFDSTSGLPALLATGRNLKYVRAQRVGDADSDGVSATYGAADIGRLLGGLAPSSDVDAVIWAGEQDHLVRRAELSGRFAGSAQLVKVEVDLHDFNRAVTVTPPPVLASPIPPPLPPATASPEPSAPPSP